MNALEELIDDFRQNKLSVNNIVWACIAYAPYYVKKKDVIEIVIRPDHTMDDIKQAARQLSKIEYDSGYGSQELYGEIVFNNGTWLERYEYDGSECWTFKSVPQFPDCTFKSVTQWLED